MELLSDRAHALYERLITADGVAQGSGPGQVGPDDPALAELYRHGLAWSSPDRVLHPVAPDLALGRLFQTRQREVLDQHRDLLADYVRLTQLARAACGSDGSHPFEVLDSAGQVRSAIRDLQAAATTEYRAIDVPWLAPDPPPAGGPARRLIWSAELPEDALTAAMDRRVSPRAALRLLTADDVGLVLPSRTGDEIAALVRAPAVVEALGEYFDLLWARAVPWDDGASPPAAEPPSTLPPVERAILNLMAGGATDATIARTLGMSPRSVRRHVAALEDRAGVASRFALGAAAQRLGWLVGEGG